MMNTSSSICFIVSELKCNVEYINFGNFKSAFNGRMQGTQCSFMYDLSLLILIMSDKKN